MRTKPFYGKMRAKKKYILPLKQVYRFSSSPIYNSWGAGYTYVYNIIIRDQVYDRIGKNNKITLFVNVRIKVERQKNCNLNFYVLNRLGDTS